MLVVKLRVVVFKVWNHENGVATLPSQWTRSLMKFTGWCFTPKWKPRIQIHTKFHNYRFKSSWIFTLLSDENAWNLVPKTDNEAIDVLMTKANHWVAAAAQKELETVEEIKFYFYFWFTRHDGNLIAQGQN